MLHSLHNTRQIAGEPKRQWFMADDLDLVVWYTPEETVCAFQLTYDRNADEHSLLWRAESNSGSGLTPFPRTHSYFLGLVSHERYALVDS